MTVVPKTGRTRETKRRYLNIEQVKEEVLKLVDRGQNYREIAKVRFKVNDKIMKVNIAQISRWKQERDKPASLPSEGSRAATAYTLFDKGKGPNQVVVLLQMPPEEADKLYQSWKNNVDATPPPRRLDDLGMRVEGIESALEDIMKHMRYSIIEPHTGCDTSGCVGRDYNNLRIEVVCETCGAHERRRVIDWQSAEEDHEKYFG